jgi:ADP-heptose:LPS heptosyltransferase
LASISPDELARELLDSCLSGAPTPEASLHQLIDQAADPAPDIARPASRALFRDLVEPLADRFEPRLCDVYVEIFSHAIARVRPDLDAAELTARYRRIRHAPHYTDLPHKPDRVIVLSRVTLGADVAVTSIVLNAAKRRFPNADIHFAGSQKGWELFEADSSLRHMPVSYGRADTLLQRLEAGRQLEQAVAGDNTLVIDPDSRLTQLGLLPVCPEDHYFFFESRAYGGDSDSSLVALTEQWVAETFGVVNATAYIAPAEKASPEAAITLSLGVGENPDKGLPPSFESELLRGLAAIGPTVLIDKGAGGDEARRVNEAIAAVPELADRIATWDGAFAPFASSIARSRLYVGYDSSGQHVAAACGVPRITLFAGYTTERMFERWQPDGRGRKVVIRASEQPPDEVLETALTAARSLLDLSQ